MYADGDWQAVEGVFSKDLATVDEFLQTWKITLSTTLSAVFHLNSKEAKRELKVNFNNAALPFCSELKYLVVTLDMPLTYRWHLESLRKKLTSRVVPFRWLAGLSCGAGATTLRTATLALIHSTAECCASTAFLRRISHTRPTDLTINHTLRTVTGCLHPTQVDNLPILAGIQPAELCRKGAPLSLACRAMEPGHLLHSALTCPPSGNARHLKYRDTHLYPPHNNPSVHLTATTEMRRSRRITDEIQRGWRTSPDSGTFIDDIGTHPPGMALPRTAWVRLNRLSTGVGLFHSCSHICGMAPSAACECGAGERTVCYVVFHCLIHRPLCSTWPECSGWWNNRMAAQHLPRDLEQPSSEL